MNEKKRLALPALMCLSVLATACTSAPERTDVATMMTLPPAQSGKLQEVADSITADLRPNESAFWLLDRADFSFDIRLALVDRAVESLDIQYFIWEKDASSRLFAHRLVQAADRGVRVRILLDDLTMNRQDGEFAALAKHPNISVRSFNPWNARRNFGRVFELVFRFTQVNHRMHNKIIVADHHFGMLGGRNIGDRYFGVWEDFVQNDLDIMGVGPIVDDIAASFDLYWNHALAYKLEDLASTRSASQQLAPTVAMLEEVYTDAAEKLSAYPLKTVDWNEFFDSISTSYTVAYGSFEQDLPDVLTVRPTQMNAPILEMLEQAQERVLLSTAYLIPDDDFFELLARLESRGVEVTLLTNSLASNNHMLAHTAYKRWRKRLLAIGVDLYESRHDSAYIDYYSVPPVEPGFLGLHTKAIVVDDHLGFVGSPNIDPRSLVLNTELGIFFESEELTADLARLIERDLMPEAAWRVYTDEKGRLRWASGAGTVKKQPALGFKQRLITFFINWLPLKKQA